MLTGRIFSQRLDRSKPLWELWLVQGLEGNRFALINKTHHSLVDGVSGVDITTVLFDTSPTPTPIARRELDAGGRAQRRGAGGRGREGHRDTARARRAPRARRGPAPARDRGRGARGGGGARRHRLELREPAARDAAERADRAPSPGAVAAASRSRS